jgi:hypothetical protein
MMKPETGNLSMNPETNQPLKILSANGVSRALAIPLSRVRKAYQKGLITPFAEGLEFNTPYYLPSQLEEIAIVTAKNGRDLK